MKIASDYALAVTSIAEMVKKFGQKVEVLNEYCRSSIIPIQAQQAAVEVHLELNTFFALTVEFLQDPSSGILPIALSLAKKTLN